MVRVIDRFDGDFAFLSNFYPSELYVRDRKFPTVEHAYQALKSTDPSIWDVFASPLVGTPGHAKKLGRTIKLRPDWEEIKISIMTILVVQKFEDTELRKLLKQTGDAELIEGNWWGDTFWGVCKGVGKNNLGKILMQTRDSIQNDQLSC